MISNFRPIWNELIIWYSFRWTYFFVVINIIPDKLVITKLLLKTSLKHKIGIFIDLLSNISKLKLIIPLYYHLTRVLLNISLHLFIAVFEFDKYIFIFICFLIMCQIC